MSLRGNLGLRVLKKVSKLLVVLEGVMIGLKADEVGQGKSHGADKADNLEEFGKDVLSVSFLHFLDERRVSDLLANLLRG